jgi:NAD(P)-dependent dehydrogenase (short-subunit alcohol dehydrogenase family)
MEQQELSGQVAIVTGAGTGIGRAVALELASMGADVVIAERDAARGEKTAEEVRALGRQVLAISTDTSKATDRAEMARRTVEEFGRIDILVNNAGIHRSALALDVTEEHWDEIQSINAKGVFFCCQAVLPTMVAQKRGNVVSIASAAGKGGSKTSIAYGVSKASVISMTRGLALSFASDGIRVNCVCPGYVDTEMPPRTDAEMVSMLGYEPGQYLRQVLADIPLGRAASPEDVANVVGFLVSSKGSYMTGQALNVTGGRIMH